MCLGLGSLSESQNARFQLVFLQLVLQNVLGVVSRLIQKKKKRLRGFDSNEQSDDCVTIFDPVFTPGDTSYLRDHAGYVVLPVRLENEGWVIAVSFSDRCPTTADRAKRLPDGAVHSGVYAALRPVPVRDFPEGQLVSGEDQECVHRGQ